jgi:hypothetical protein
MWYEHIWYECDMNIYDMNVIWMWMWYECDMNIYDMNVIWYECECDMNVIWTYDMNFCDEKEDENFNC